MLNKLALSIVFGMFLLSTVLAITFSTGAGPRVFAYSQVAPTPTPTPVDPTDPTPSPTPGRRPKMTPSPSPTLSPTPSPVS